MALLTSCLISASRLVILLRLPFSLMTTGSLSTLGVATISADVTDETAAHRILAEVRPDILALNAGTTPRMGRLDQLSWADFTAPWETDVKAGLYWLQAALNLPLKPGSRVLVEIGRASCRERV